MTTTIQIRHRGPDHHNVKVTPISNGGRLPTGDVVLGPGQSYETTLWDGRSVEIAETPVRDAPTFDRAPDAKTPGQIAFEAYNLSKGGLTWDGKPIPGWETLTNEAGVAVRAGWEAAARAVLAL